MTVCLLATISFTVIAAQVGAAPAVTLNDKGIGLAPDSYGGAFIKVNNAGLEVGKTYTIEYVIKSNGTTGFRVRYTDGDGSRGTFAFNDDKIDVTDGSYTGKAHSSPSATAVGTTANQIPAVFSDETFEYGGVGLLTVHFTFGAEIPGLDPLTMDYIGLFGYQGGDSYEVLGMTLKNADGNEISTAGDMTMSGTPAATATPAPAAPGTYTRENFFTLVKDGDIEYQLHRPANPEPGKKYPILFRLHGSGLSDYVEQYPYKGSVGLIEDFIDDINTNPDQYESYVVMTINPDPNGGPAPDVIKHIIDMLLQEDNADPDRVYIYGFSMGGFATSDFVIRYPNVAAAVIMMCGASPLSSDEAKSLVNLPMRLYHSADDDTVSVQVSRNFYAAMQAAGQNKTEYTEVDGLGHSVWSYAYGTDMIDWMFAQKRSDISAADISPLPTPAATNAAIPAATPIADASAQPSATVIVIVVIAAVVVVGAIVLFSVKRKR